MYLEGERPDGFDVSVLVAGPVDDLVEQGAESRSFRGVEGREEDLGLGDSFGVARFISCSPSGVRVST